MSVVEAFKNLNVASARDTSDHETIYEVSFRYLEKAKNFNDPVAFKTCLVALINMDKYYKAMDVIKQVPEEILSEFPLEVSYVYYKVGDAGRLENVYKSVVGDQGTDVLSRAMKHVLAQSLYQRGFVGQALDLYHDLISSNTIDSELDLACNERAILYQGALTKDKVPRPASNIAPSQQTYDYLFNNGLIEIAQGAYTTALELLNKALQLCHKQNAELSEEDLLLEVAPIKVAIAYAHQKSGSPEEALQIFESIQSQYLSDGLIQLILKTNYTSVLPQQQNVNLTQRQLDLQHGLHVLRSKLTRQQWQTLVKNHLLLSYQADTLTKKSSYLSNRSLEEFSLEFTGDLTLHIFKILTKLDITFEDLTSHSQNKAVARKLFGFVNKEINDNGESALAIAGTLLEVSVNRKQGKYDQSLVLLERLVSGELSSSGKTLHGALLGELIYIYETLNLPRKLNELYEQVVANLSERPDSEVSESQETYGLICAIAFKLLSLGDEERSKKLFSKLSRCKSEDAVVQAVLTGTTDKLTPIEELAAKEDVADLLTVNVETLVSVPEMVPGRQIAKNASAKVEKKARKPKFSKHKAVKPDAEFNPEKDLDKERWLPMTLRSYYKPTKKERKKAGGHQGALESLPAPTSGQTGGSKQKKKKGKK